MKEERGERGGRVTWEEGGCTKLEAATLPALTWDGTFKHGFHERLLLFLHLSFKRPSSPLIILFCFKGFSTNVSRRPLATPGFNLLLSWSHLQREAPPPLPLPLLLLPGDSLSKKLRLFSWERRLNFYSRSETSDGSR